MNVLILITKSNLGGAQQYVYDLATNLPKDIYEVEVMAGGNGPLINNLLKAGINANGDLPIDRNINLIGDIKAFFKLIKIIRDKRPDILHLNSSKIAGLGALAGRILGIPKIIFTIHSWAFNENRTFWSKIILKLNYWIIIMLSHKVIAVSESTKHQARNWPKISNKITVIYNGIKGEPCFSKINARLELAKINKQFSEILKSKTKDLTILGSVGELHHIKGYDYSIRAIHNHIKGNSKKKILYIIFGSGEERENLEKTIKDLGLESNIILFGNVPNAFHYLKAFDIFLISSISEGLPYMALEAGYSGLPIISTSVGGIPEIIDDMKSGVLIQAKKINEIRHAIEFYLDHKKVQKEHSIAISKKIKDEFSLEQMIAQTIKIYSSK